MVGFFIGFEIGLLVAIAIFAIYIKISKYGLLHLIETDGEEPYLFLELDKKPEGLRDRKYVMLKIKANDRPPRE